MGFLQKGMIFILFVNLLFVFAQAATIAINPSLTDAVYNCEGDLLSEFDQNHCTTADRVLVSVNDTNRLPGGTNTVTEQSGNFFTDTFNSIKRWFNESTGVVYFRQILGGPHRFLTALNLPLEYVWGLSALWYAFSLMAIINFIKGGEW